MVVNEMCIRGVVHICVVGSIGVVDNNPGCNLSLNAPATTGAFYFFNQHHKPLNQPLIPGTIEGSKSYPKTLQQTVAMTAQQT